MPPTCPMISASFPDAAGLAGSPAGRRPREPGAVGHRLQRRGQRPAPGRAAADPAPAAVAGAGRHLAPGRQPAGLRPFQLALLPFLLPCWAGQGCAACCLPWCCSPWWSTCSGGDSLAQALPPRPQLAQRSAQGFGMPSGHVASTLLYWGLLLTSLPALRPPAGGVLALLLAGLAGSGAGLAGGALFSDVVAGLALGTLLLALHAPGCTGCAPVLLGNSASGQHPGRLAHPVHHPGGSPCSPWGSHRVICYNSNGTRLPPSVRHCWPWPAAWSSPGCCSWCPCSPAAPLLILAGNGLLYGGLGFWLSAGFWWLLSVVPAGSPPPGAPPLVNGNVMNMKKVDLAKITLGVLFLSLLIISCFMVLRPSCPPWCGPP